MAPTIKPVPPTKFKHLVKRTAGSRVAAPPTVLTSTTGNGAEPMAEAILISRLRAEPVIEWNQAQAKGFIAQAVVRRNTPLPKQSGVSDEPV